MTRKGAAVVCFFFQIEKGEKAFLGNRRYLDFLDILLTAKDSDGTGLSHQDIQAEVDTFLFEGTSKQEKRRERRVKNIIRASLSSSQAILKPLYVKCAFQREACCQLPLPLPWVLQLRIRHDKQTKETKNFVCCSGHDTTGSALAWTLYMLAKYPEHQQKCQDEIDKIMEGKDEDFFEWYILVHQRRNERNISKLFSFLFAFQICLSFFQERLRKTEAHNNVSQRVDEVEHHGSLDIESSHQTHGDQRSHAGTRNNHIPRPVCNAQSSGRLRESDREQKGWRLT